MRSHAFLGAPCVGGVARMALALALLAALVLALHASPALMPGFAQHGGQLHAVRAT